MTTRRRFIRQVSMLLTSLAAAHCTALPKQDSTPRNRLRTCWLSFDEAREQAKQGYEQGNAAMDQLQAEHRAALDELVAANELGAATAEDVQVIYEEALSHIRSSMMTCYEAVRYDLQFSAREQVIQQTKFLVHMAKKDDLDPQTVAQVQANLERDAAYLDLPTETREKLYNEALAAGKEYPQFTDLDLEVGPEAAEAARFLIALLSEL